MRSTHAIEMANRHPDSIVTAEDISFDVKQPTTATNSSTGESGAASKIMGFVTKKNMIAVGVTAAVLVAIAVGVSVAVASGSGGSSSTSDTSPIDQPYDLRPASQGQLLVLENLGDILADGSPRQIAISYDGHNWEPTAQQDVTIPDVQCESNANGTNCRVLGLYNTRGRGSYNMGYNIREIPIPAKVANVSNSTTAARLFTQATFGANMDELEAFDGNVEGWISDQMQRPMTLMRKYLRERTTPRRATLGHGDGSLYFQCDVGSRWHRYMFNLLDVGSIVIVSTNSISNKFSVHVDGILRGELTHFLDVAHNTSLPGYPKNFTICSVNEFGGGFAFPQKSVNLVTPFRQNGRVRTCSDTNYLINFANPAISIATPSPDTTQTLNPGDATFTPIEGVNGSYTLSSLNVPCQGRHDKAIAYLKLGDDVYRYDPRLKLAENTLSEPARMNLSGSLTCPLVPKNRQNSQFCQVRPACSAPQFTSGSLRLNDTMMSLWYTTTQQYVYYIKGLRLEGAYSESPCVSGTSRWLDLKTSVCTETSGVSGRTKTTIRSAIAATTPTNPHVVDITLTGQDCDNSNTQNMVIQVNGTNGPCYQHVHPQHLDVIDFSRWVLFHDGNEQAFKNGHPNPIAKWARSGLQYLEYPAWHSMDRWRRSQAELTTIGRYEEIVDFDALPTSLQTEPMARAVGAARSHSGQGFLACGSMGETSNNATKGHRYIWPEPIDEYQTYQTDWPASRTSGKSVLWQNVALTAPDQLRHRVAWSMLNWLVIADAFAQEENEIWAHYYDILVKNAFGNYRDILHDISYSPLMAEYLSFRKNRAYAYDAKHPDENFARELQQLFSIGLWQLNDDGTQVKDARGNPIPTYTNADIQTQARIWTGHDRQALRSNVEREDQTNSRNLFDPLQLKPVWRDPLPKMNLYGGHIGDGYHLCEDAPPRHWLKPGARFEHTGTSSDEGDEVDAQATDGWGNHPRLRPAAGSPLYQVLCAAQGGACTFPDEVTLSAELSCVGYENSQECRADRVVVIKIVDSTNNATRYYTYHQAPCVELTFFNNGVGKWMRRYSSTLMCGNPKLPLGLPACCKSHGTHTRLDGVRCLFSNERMTYATSVARCQELTPSDNPAVCSNPARISSSTNARSCSIAGYQWMNKDCSIQVQVLNPNGHIGVVDGLAGPSTHGLVFREDGTNSFRVKWTNDAFPSAPNCPSGCRFVNTAAAETCVCNITRVTNDAVYRSMDELPAHIDSIGLHIAASVLPTNLTHNLTLRSDGVKIWVPMGERNNPQWSKNAIFELSPFRKGGKVRYLLNRESLVFVGDSAGQEYSFRNPPHFMPLFGKYTKSYKAWNSDKLWMDATKEEIQALLTHLFEHNSTAPFVCYRLAQHMVTSNPSPRYMRAMVKAFRTGEYGGKVYSGKYGDLAATVAALLLDPEARSPLLEAFPTHGMVRDPLLKINSILKALEYKSTHGQEVIMYDMFEKIGVEAFRSSSVFGFYQHDFRPAGAMSDMGLSAPQAQIINGPNLVSWLNGVYSLVDNGLTSCKNGFAYWKHPAGRSCSSTIRARATADGHLTYQPADPSNAARVVDDLDLLLLQRRLNTGAREYLIRDYEQQGSVNRVIKLMLTSAEFHVTNLVRPNAQSPRSGIREIPSQGRRPKYIIVVYKAGGLDSFNLLVPHSGCGSHDLNAEYRSVRGSGLALSNSQLERIDVTGQPCTKFGVHEDMPKLAQMYRDNDALFIANIGGLVQPMTLADYYGTSAEAVNKKRPPALFSHNGMTDVAQNGDALNSSATGILGRIARSLENQGYRTEVISMDGNRKIVEGSLSPYTTINPRTGVIPFMEYDQVSEALGNFSQYKFGSSLAEAYQDSSLRSMSQLKKLSSALSSVQLNTSFTATIEKNRVADQLRAIAEIIQLRRGLGTERGVFYVNAPGYDTHNQNDIGELLKLVDEGIDLFKQEMQAQGMWDDVVIVESSEFGRTLVGNGQGTDHAWGGNIWVAGGAVRGGQVLGEYPTSLTPEVDVVFNSRGRVLPTTPWEAVWKGVAEWFGVPENEMDGIFPNAKKWPANKIYNANQLFV